jgi:hypothetical protein
MPNPALENSSYQVFRQNFAEKKQKGVLFQGFPFALYLL